MDSEGAGSADQQFSPSGNPIGTADKDEVRRKILEEAKNIRIRRSEGKYNYDNPDIEHKSSW